MKNRYAHSFRGALLLLTLGSAFSASAQYVFSDSNLGPYRQNFNSLPDTVSFSFGTATLPSMQGVYAEVQADPQFGNGSLFPWTVRANDGSVVSGNFYHFGEAGAADRAFGGIAETGLYTGKGYVGIRLKNSSSTVIQNLEIQYAMEQWYNSGNAEAAYVQVSYRRSSGMSGENFASLSSTAVGNAWTPIPDLTVQAPSTGTVIQSRDGNSAANRRIVQTTLADLNLAVGQEIMIRWDYVLNPTTNGNGVSIDDVVITPQTSVYFAQGSAFVGRPAAGSTTGVVWQDAAGVSPTNLAAPNRTYYIRGAVDAAALPAVTGANSKIIVGTPALNGEPAQPGSLTLTENTLLLVPIDVAAGSTLRIGEGAADTPFTLGTLAPTSKVVYESATATHAITAGNYGELILTGAGPKQLTGSVTLGGNLQLNGARLTLGAFDATILKGRQVVGATATDYVVTDGRGRLRQSVLADDAEVVFPIGTTTDYQPLTLRQSAFRSEDVFAVRVMEGKYATYTADETGIGSPLEVTKGVRKTWFVSEEVPGNINLTLKAQWYKADESADFEAGKAFLSHFHNGAWDQTVAAGATPVGTGPDSFTTTRAGITSLSPFTVSSEAGQPLPVELVSFTAYRTRNMVNCAWITATERGNAFFSLERSLDGVGYSTIGTLKGAGTSAGQQHYSLPDRQPAVQTAYYRLRQVDGDGKTSYSSVVVVKGEFSASSIMIVPNPSTGPATILVRGNRVATLHGTVLNALGVEIMRFAQTPKNESPEQIHIDLSTRPAGVYLIRLEMPEGTQTLRLVKL